MNNDDPQDVQRGSAEVEPEAEQPPITLDRYLSRRRPQPKVSWVQLVSMLLMLAAMISIILFKERCGQMTAQIFGDVEHKSEAEGIPVRYQPVPQAEPAGAAAIRKPAKEGSDANR